MLRRELFRHVLLSIKNKEDKTTKSSVLIKNNSNHTALSKHSFTD